jgi:hypothetical protein
MLPFAWEFITIITRPIRVRPRLRPSRSLTPTTPQGSPRAGPRGAVPGDCAVGGGDCAGAVGGFGELIKEDGHDYVA